MVFAISVFLGTDSSYVSAKTKLEYKSTSIGINGNYTIYLTGKVKKASYQFVSKNKKIATVSKNGVVKGVAAGKAKVDVFQKLKKAKTKVGTFTVTVKKATLYSGATNGSWVSNQPGLQKNNPAYFYASEYINYYNSKAKYKIYSSDSSKLSITTDGKVKDAKGSGKVKLIFKETYKGKTRVVGKINVELRAPSYTGKADEQIVKNDIFEVDSYIEAVGRYYVIFDTDDKDYDPNEEDASDDGKSEGDEVLQFVYDSDGNWNGIFRGLSAGKRYIKLYAYDYNKKKYITTPFAKFTLTVKEIKNAEKIQTDFDMYSDDYEYNKSTDTFTMYENSADAIRIYQTPYNYTEDIKITSSDDKVVKVPEFEKCDGYDKEEGYIGKMFLVPVKAGNATITIEANGAKRIFNVVVKDSSSYTDSDEYFTTVMLDKDIDDTDDGIYEEDFTVKSSNKNIVKAEVNSIVKNSNGDKIKAISLSMVNGSQAGTATITISYKGEKVGSIKVKVVEDSDDDY